MQVLAVVVLACAVRLCAIAWVPGWHSDPSAAGDAPDFHHLAVNLSAGRGYALAWEGGGAGHGELRPTAKRAPLWPAVLGGLYRLAGPSPAAGRALLVALDALACAGLVMLGSLVAGWRAGLVAGFLAAVYPALWMNVFVLHSEVLFALTILAALIAAELLRRRPTPRRAAALGGMLALVTLARPNGIVLAVALLAWTAWLGSRVSGRSAVGLVTACAAPLIVVVGAWVAWGALRVGIVAPVTTQGGQVLAGYYSPLALDRTSTSWGAWDFGRVVRLEAAASDEAAYDRAGRELGLRFIGDHPGGAVEIVGLHVLRYFNLYWDPGNPFGWDPGIWRSANEVAVPAWWLAALLAGLGLWRLRGRLSPWYPALLAFGTLALSGVFLGGTSRLRTPSDPVVLLLAAVGLAGHRPT